MSFFLSFLSGIVLFYFLQFFPFSAISTFLLSSICLSLKKRIFPILIILLGIAFAFFRYEPVKELPHISGKEVVLEGFFSSLPAETERGMFRQSLQVQSASDKNTAEEIGELSKQEVVILSDREFIPGTECKMTAKFLSDRKRLNPGNFTSKEVYVRLLESNKTENKRLPLITKTYELRYMLSKYIQANFKRDSAAFISAITTGQRSSIDEDMRNAFNKTGLAHILSISGTHFGLFSIFLFGIFRFLINALPYRVLQRITIFLTPSQAAAILCLPFMLAYLGLSGGNIPAVRSFIMVGLFLLGLLIGRKGLWLNSLFFAAFILAIWDPKVILDLSFQLSFLAVLFIGFSIKNREDEIKQEEDHIGETKFSLVIRKIFMYFKNALLLTLSASIGTAPLVAYHFHYFSIISPISNLFITPIIGFVLIPLSILSSFLFLITGHYIFTPVVSTVSDISISLVRLMSAIPYADIKVPSFPLIVIFLFYAGFLFYFLSGRKRYTLMVPFLPIIIYFLITLSEKKEITVTYLDVGQGDSSVIELPDGKTIVIDTGRSGRETASFLKYRGKEEIDALVLSHVHPDHTGGLDYLLKRFEVQELWDNGRIIFPEDYLTHKKIKHRALNRGDIIEGKGYSIYILHPYPEFYTMYGNDYVEANNDSIVLKIKSRERSFLFPGDVEEETEEDLLYLGDLLKSNVIKVPHHGGKTSAYKSFYELVSPEIAVISSGKDNAFSHPHKETFDVLQGSRIFRTDTDGAIKIKESENELEIKTYKNFKFVKTRAIKDEMQNIAKLFKTW